MKWERTSLNSFLQAMVFVIWLGALVILLLDEQYVVFLRPEFAWILILAIGILLGFLRVYWNETRTQDFDLAGILRLIILLMPLLYLSNVRGRSLDSYALANRSLGLPALPETNSQLNQPWQDDSNEKILHEFTLADLYRAPDRYMNQRVKLIGRYHRDERAIQDLGSGIRVIFRFVINCCAADATPLAVLADVNEATPLDDINESAWVEVEGTFNIREEADRRLPLLENAILRPTSPPKRPYLF